MEKQRNPEIETIVYTALLLALMLAIFFGGSWLIVSLGQNYEYIPKPSPIPVVAVPTPEPTPIVAPTPMFAPIPQTPTTVMFTFGTETGYCVPYHYLSESGCREYCDYYNGCTTYQGSEAMRQRYP